MANYRDPKLKVFTCNANRQLAKEIAEQQSALAGLEEEASEIDELLNDNDIESDMDKKNDIKTISSSLNVVDNDVIDVGDDT